VKSVQSPDHRKISPAFLTVPTDSRPVIFVDDDISQAPGGGCAMTCAQAIKEYSTGAVEREGCAGRESECGFEERMCYVWE
jgi:hypothetical protein